MSLTKPEVASSDFIKTGDKKPHTAEIVKKAYKQAVNRNSTMYTLGLLVWKHRHHITALGCVVLVLNWVFPEWFTLVKSLI